MAFIPGIQGCFNIHEAINVIYHIYKRNDKNHDNLKRCRKSIHPLMINAHPSWYRGNISQYYKHHL